MFYVKLTIYWFLKKKNWIVLQNSLLFDGPDWIKVSYTFSDGMKMYVAEMTCPICHGKVSPQNKEKEAGRLPKWDLYCVKRHVKAVHGNKEGKLFDSRK